MKAAFGRSGASGPHQGLPAGAGTADRVPDAAQAPPRSLSGARLGAPVGLLASVPEGADVEESRVGQALSMRNPGL